MTKLVYFLLVYISLTSSSIMDRDGSESIRIYPLPLKGVARVSCDQEVQKIEVYNILGTKVLERNGEGDLDFTNLQSGYYLIKALSDKGEIVRRVQKH